MDKPILYIDMDGVLVNFQSGIDRLSEELRQEYAGRYDEAPGIFALMEPMPGAIEVIYKLQSDYDIYILSTAPWNNPSAWADKVEWVQRFLPQIGYKRPFLAGCTPEIFYFCGSCR
jgi:5'(3')-deoxyribonucleotidase